MPRSARLIPVLAAVGFAVLGAVEIALDPGFRSAPLALALVLLPVVSGTLLATVAPIAGTAVASLMFPVATAVGLGGPTGVGVLACFLLPGWAAFRRPPRRSWIAPASVQLLATVGVAIGGALSASVGGELAAPASRDLAAAVWENLFFASLAWVSWAVGLVARGARDRADRLGRLAAALDAEREAREHAALVDERQRIAREIHDAVAHSVSVMTLQVGAVRSTLSPDAPQAEMLRGIERLGRESVAELRTLVGILRDTDDVPPAAPPSVARAGELVDEVRAAGLEVAFEQRGDPGDLPRGVDVSAYRVLQEALTNVLRHAPGARTTVAVERTDGALVVAVSNTAPEPVPVGAGGAASGAAQARPAPPGGSVAPAIGGHGLVGMRERVAMFHGRFSAGPGDDGGFDVRAEFPLEATR
ncbi:sensor histidine kinase [Agromyces sp. SYSU T00266]|uniref:sensor histidine kinase n=1 Tax=Agromyces zhanjiangensis TaxID=3158562 RepID=UPI0033963403